MTAKPTANPRPTAVRLERILPAPPREVYRAWLEPDLLPTAERRPRREGSPRCAR